MKKEIYHKYFHASKKDESWGIYLLDCGVNYVTPGISKRYLDHPNKYTFTWEKGRILQEYQLIYLLSGNGIFESSSCQSTTIRSGDLILLHPKIWHRYKPEIEFSWESMWIGFDGELSRKLIPQLSMPERQPILHIGYNKNLLEIFNSIIDISKSEFSGFQQVIAGEILRLLGWIHVLSKKGAFKESNIDSIMQQAKNMLRAQEQYKSIHHVASDLNIGYSKFRKLFKEYTGISPGQFRLHYLIKRAEFLLQENQLSIQEICDHLGFESTQYFSRIFKSRSGKSPGEFRKMNLRSTNY